MADDGDDRQPRPPDGDPTPVPAAIPGLEDWFGGFAPGSLVSVVAPPDSPSEELCYPPADANPGRYLSTLRPAQEVREHAAAVGYDDVDVREVEPGPLLDDPEGHLSGLAPASVVVVDPATGLEREGRERYRSFLETLKRATRATESVAVLHCPRMNPRALQRDLTLARADTVLDVRAHLDAESEERMAAWHSLSVRKARFDRPRSDPVALSFRDGPAGDPLDEYE